MKTKINRMRKYIFISLVFFTSFFAFNINVDAKTYKATLGSLRGNVTYFQIDTTSAFGRKMTFNGRDLSCSGLPAGVTTRIHVSSEPNTLYPHAFVYFANATGNVVSGDYKGTCTWIASKDVKQSVNYELTVAKKEAENNPIDSGNGNGNGNGNSNYDGTVDFLGIDGAAVNSNGFEQCSGGYNGQVCRFQYNKTYNMPRLGSHSQYGNFVGWSTTNASQYCSEVQKYGNGDIAGSTFKVSGGTNYKYYAIFEKSCDSSSSSGGDVNYTMPGSGNGNGGGTTAPTTDPYSGTDFIEVNGVCNTYKVSVEKAAYSQYDIKVTKKKTHNINLFKAEDQCNNTEYYAFCYDPNKSSPGGGTIYEIQDVINPFDDVAALGLPAEQSKAFEGFVYYIYRKYAPQNGELTDQTRAAIQMAMRVYWTNQGAGHGKGDYTPGYYALAVRWTCIFNNDDVCPQAAGLADFTFHDTSLEKETRDIYLEAMGAANTCLYGGGCSGLQQKVGVEWSKPDAKVECETEGGQLVKKATGKVTGLTTYTTSYVLQEMICPTGLTCELYINDGLVKVGTNLKGMADGKYMIKVKGTKDAFANASGQIGMKIKTESTDDFHNILAIQPQKEKQKKQRMIIFLKGKENILDIELIDVSALTCDGGCNISPELNPNMPETFNEDKYKQLCCNDPSADPEYCPEPEDPCVQIIWNIVCGADGEVYSIKEGISKEGKLDYEKCIINQDDVAGNPYVANGSGGGMPKVGNRYCTVSCKEDWEFEMPGYLGQHDAGRYFLLNINRVQGTRTCVTGSPKGKSGKNVTEILNDYDLQESFQKDLERVDAGIINALNRLAEARAYVYRWDKGYSAGIETKEVSCGGGNVLSCGREVSEHKASASVEKHQLAAAVTYYQYSIIRKASYNANGKIINTIAISQPRSVTTDKECKNGSLCGYLITDETDQCDNSCSVTATEAKDDYGLDAWRAQASEAEGTLQILLAERKEMISDIKECSNWANNYHFEPEITYTYAENDYMNMVGGNNQFRITGGGDPAAIVNEESFRDEASKADSYDPTSSTSEKTFLNTENIFDVDYSSPEGKFIVTENLDDNIPYNSSIMKVVGYEASYEIKGAWYTIHDSGAMEYVDTENAEKTTGDRTLVGESGKVMPISINTPSGQYEYQLRFVDIGQYNDSNVDTPGTDNLGRLIGGDDNAHSGRNSIFNAMSYLQPEIGQTYLCYYDVVDHNKCATKIKTEIVSLLDCPDAYNCPGYGNGGAYLDPNGDVSFFVRTISLNDMNPTGRQLGTNWSSEEGAAAMSAIESAGDEIFAKNPEYSFTLTPTGMASVRAMAQSTNYGGFELSCDENGDNCENGWLENLKSIAGVTVNQFRN